jgi:hypothetical protein
MSLFSRDVRFEKVEHDILSLGILIPNIVLNYSTILEKALVQMVSKKFNKTIEFKDIEVKNCGGLMSYGVIMVGSYLNGQRIMSGKNWEKTMNLVKETVCANSKGHIEPIGLEQFISYFNTFENDRFYQARKVIEKHYLDNIKSDGLGNKEKEEIYNELMPLIEYLCTYFTLFIDNRMNKKDFAVQHMMKKEYAKYIKEKINIDFEVIDSMFEAYLR